MMNTKILFATDRLEKYGNIIGYLEKSGFSSVIIATNGDEVLKHLKDSIPDFAILDVNLPIMDGFQLCKIMKSDGFGRWGSIPVVLLSETHRTDMTFQLAKSVGAYEILYAPFTREDLLFLIYKYTINLISDRLDEAELRLHSMVDGMVDGVMVMDAKSKITIVNKAGKEMLKHLDINRAEDDSIVNIDDVSIKEIYNEIFIKKQGYSSFEINAKGKDEKHFIIIASPVNGFADENRGVVIVLRDVTREYQLQSQVIKSERLYAVSNLVAGAAHELNNPLAGIQLCTELVLSDSSISERAKKYLNRIQKETEQIQDVVKSLLTFTGNYTLSKEPINVNDAIEEIVSQKTYQFDYANIKLVKLLDGKLATVFVDKHQIRRVFLNIIENACASMSELKSEKRLTIQTEGQKEGVKITISDTGPGIPNEYLSKIFEPFFTTKDYKKSKGTGLGLSIVHSIVHQHNGKVYAKSELGKGATFIIELPLR